MAVAADVIRPKGVDRDQQDAGPDRRRGGAPRASEGEKPPGGEAEDEGVPGERVQDAHDPPEGYRKRRVVLKAGQRVEKGLTANKKKTRKVPWMSFPFASCIAW